MRSTLTAPICRRTAQNEIILTTIRLLEDQGEEWNDLLPISRTSPFVFLDGQETRISSILAKFRLNQVGHGAKRHRRNGRDL